MLIPQQQSNLQDDYLTLKSIEHLRPDLPTESSPPTPSTALKVVQIGYSPKFSYPPKRSIIHDVNCFTKRRKKDSFKGPQDSENSNFKGQNAQRNNLWAEVTKEWGMTRSGNNLEVLIPSPREHLDSLKTGLKSAREQNAEYLRQNNSIVKQKIRSKMLGEKGQPLNKSIAHSKRMDRFGKYNHVLQQFIIRKKISKRNHQTIPDEASQSSSETINLQTQEGSSERSSVLLSAKRKGTLSLFHNLTLAQENLPREPKIILVSRPNPTTHRSVKLANQQQQNKTEGRRESGASLLKRFICKNFPKGSQSASKSKTQKSALEQLASGGSFSKLTINQTPAPAHFIKLPFNCTLLKRQIKHLRKESVELPQLLSNIEAQEAQKKQASLDAKINSKKFNILFDAQPSKLEAKEATQVEERGLPSKYVVYSKKNLHAGSCSK